MPRHAVPLAAAALAMSLLSAPASADRAPTAEERAEIERALRDSGFTIWGVIVFDEDDRTPHWEVEDARDAEGRQYDLELTPDTYEVIGRDLDD